MKIPLFLIFFLFISCKSDNVEYVTTSQIYQTQINHVKNYAKSGNYSENFAILVDFSKPSNLYRMYVVDLKQEVILDDYKALVAHGSGCGQKNGIPMEFSNVSGSNCSSVGMAVIGKRDYSNWGLNFKYWVKGLESTNSNMVKRVVVMHSYGGIPDSEFILPILQSEGCFTISNGYLKKLDELIKKHKLENKMLLYAFD